jgi:hypothetical protein
MSERIFVAIYEAIAVDVLDNGDSHPAALVIAAAGKKRVIIRMDREAIIRLQARIDATFTRRKAVAGLTS